MILLSRMFEYDHRKANHFFFLFVRANLSFFQAFECDEPTNFFVLNVICSTIFIKKVAKVWGFVLCSAHLAVV